MKVNHWSSVLPGLPVFGGKKGRQPKALAAGDDFFCRTYRGEIPNRTIIAENASAFAVFDGYPVGRGHTLVVPKRHVGSFFEATQKETRDIFKLIRDCKPLLEEAMTRKGLPLPGGYNIGVNIGAAAGQTVDHLHVHLIPRYAGDMADPKGGVRGVIPEKQKYGGPPDPTVSDLLK
jgi:diadenosine tetraphosphate (Ap4A) HIT family hydrolase